jgi:ubiquinone biosynthesis protein COQ9
MEADPLDFPNGLLAAFQDALAKRKAAALASLAAANARPHDFDEIQRQAVQMRLATDCLIDLSLDHVNELVAVAAHAKQYMKTEDDEADDAMIALTESLNALEKPQ